ncbi:MAG: DUF4209 domain-containing protein [Candidatus Nanohaloarchaea archaeon]
MKDRIERYFERAGEDPEDDYHLSSTLDNQFLTPIQEERINEEPTRELFKSLELDHPIFDAIESMLDGITSEEAGIQEKEDALDELQETFENARQRNWINLATVSIDHKVKLIENHIGGKHPNDDVEQIVDFLESDFNSPEDTSASTLQLVDHIVENASYIDKDVVDRALDWLEDLRKQYHDRNNYASERMYLKKKKAIKETTGQDIEAANQKIIDSWDNEVEKKEGSEMVKSGLLSQALEECKEFIDDGKKKEWKIELKKSRENSVDEMGVIEQRFTVKDEDVEEKLEEIQQLAEDNSEVYALASVIKSRPHYFPPSIFKNRPQGIRGLLGQIQQNSAGGAVQTESWKSEYNFQLVTHSHALAILFENYQEDHIKDLIEDFLDISESLGETEKIYFSRIVENLIEERYLEAYHIAIPHLERVLLNELGQQEEAVLALNEEGEYTKTLGSLLGELEDYFEEEYIEYLKHMYNESSGLNRRNTTSHGLLDPEYAGFKENIVLLLDLLYIVFKFEEDTYLEQIDEPEELSFDIIS